MAKGAAVKGVGKRGSKGEPRCESTPKKWESPKSVLHVRRIAKEASRIKREKKDRRREERKLEIAKKAGAGARSVFWRPIAPIANNFVGGVFDMRGV
jgi:hypothetical protein